MTLTPDRTGVVGSLLLCAGLICISVTCALLEHSRDIHNERLKSTDVTGVNDQKHPLPKHPERCTTPGNGIGNEHVQPRPLLNCVGYHIWHGFVRKGKFMTLVWHFVCICTCIDSTAATDLCAFHSYEKGCTWTRWQSELGSSCN